MESSEKSKVEEEENNESPGSPVPKEVQEQMESVSLEGDSAGRRLSLAEEKEEEAAMDSIALDNSDQSREPSPREEQKPNPPANIDDELSSIAKQPAKPATEESNSISSFSSASLENNIFGRTAAAPAPSTFPPPPTTEEREVRPEPALEAVKEDEVLQADTVASLPSLVSKTTVIHSNDETPQQTFDRLIKCLVEGTIERSQLVDTLFNVLVGGPFDLESRFIIEDSQNIDRMLALLTHCDEALQSEIWSVFLAVVRKSNRNLEACSRVSLISRILDLLPTAQNLLSDLLVQLLGVLTSYSITVKETKQFLRSLQAVNDVWPRNSIKLLQVMNSMPRKDGADVFFSFPGKASAGIILPPMAKFPCQNGWTFSTWFRMDPLNSVNFEKERPYLYCFRTSKGFGYSCIFTGNCLVINAEKGKKSVTKCIKAELIPRRWHHVAISHNYSRWGRCDVKCYIDGQLAEAVELSWPVSTSDHLDRCAIGVSPEGDVDSAFCGQMGAVYVFAESLSLQQANSLFCLGPDYQSYFKHDAESNLPDGYKKHLFDGQLNASLVVAYCPKNCHGQLCLLSPPKNNSSYFVQIPHAVMKEGVEVITTHSIHNSLQSVGGIQILLPLFSQLDLSNEDGSEVNVDVCSTLLSLISLLLSSSQTSQQQLFHSKGFLIIAHALQKSSSTHLTLHVVKRVIGMAKFLLRCPAGIPLLKQLFDHILFNPRLWIASESSVQVLLYHYLATDFLANSNFSQILRRASTIVEMCHALKYYYWVVKPRAPSAYTVEDRAENFPNQDVVTIRGGILTFINRLLMMNTEDGTDAMRDDEIHTLLSFVATVYEDDNLYDVLTLLNRLLADHPALMIPALDRNRALGIIFKLLASSNQLIRIPALKLLGFFLARSTIKRKSESVGSLNLFTLLTERLLLHCNYLSMPVYNVLLEILTEKMTNTYTYTQHNAAQLEWKFENPTMLKVIANLISQSEETGELMEVKKAFLIDVINMCRDGKENRRIILQMSVWQEWLMGLSYVFPEDDSETEISELVFEVFSILLNHAIRYEFGGWRVWVDTLAIAHSKVSWEKFRREQLQNNSPRNQATAMEGTEDKPSPTAEEKLTPIYRTPDFRWSKVHLRLLNDLLIGIENVVGEWNASGQAVAEQCGHSENQVLIGNVVHVLSQLIDSLIMACGGLLPLLASATSPNSELDITDSCKQDLSIHVAASLLSRFALLADVFIFASGVSFQELEQEKNMPSGGVLRQALRLVSTVAVRHILASRIASPDGHRNYILDQKASLRNESIMEFVKGAIDAPGKEGLQDMEKLLQDVDLLRIKNIVYRDMVEENRQAQFLALSVIYLMSVLMVSRYRDILEPPASPSPFFNSTNVTQDTPRQSVDAAPSESDPKDPSTPEEAEKKLNGDADGDEVDLDRGVSAIKVAQGSIKKDGKEYKEEELNKLSAGRAPAPSMSQAEVGDRRNYLTNKLQAALDTTAPLLREIMADFRPYLTKTLLGTHGQEIMNDNKVQVTLKNMQGSVIELVMLLCSQEWQTSLQKHAGLAFIELVNEGRLMAHATRDHVLRVSNEADFILNRLRAEDVSKHAQFESETAEQLHARREEETRCDQLIRSGRRRDGLIAAKLLDKMTTILRSPSGAWCSQDKSPQMFWRQDLWEDDSRRRKRFVPNVYGSRHEEASVVQTPLESDETDEDRLRRIAESLAPGRGSSSELVDESDIDKWAAEVDPVPSSETTSFSTPAKLIAPGLIVPGTLSITSTDLYFDADEENPLYKQQDPKVLRYCESLHGRWNLNEMRAVFLRRHLLQNIALEFFIAARTAIMFAFADQATVKKVVYQLPRVGVGVKYGLPQSRKTSLMTPRQLFKHSDMCQKWQKREISNFDYLMFLNTVAGRTYNDLNQYPVFPWILTDYTSEKLDLSVASSFRDLSKPVGALSESRRKYFQDRYSSWEDDTIPPFHYGTHYSTQSFTLNWLLRVEPFATMFLHLQSGKFDHPDRVFHSMEETWDRCQRDSHDVKELIPELFYMPELMRNSNGFELGSRADGSKVDDVILPKWAKSPEQFILLHRQALESDLVSCQLNQWIDLIFGYKQRGPEAVRATNVFYYLTYEGGVDLKSIENPTLQEAIQQQIQSFGQTPVQLMLEAHPPRHSVMTMAPMMFRRVEDDLCMLMKFISNSPIVYLAANTFHQVAFPCVISIANNLVFSLNKWDNSFSYTPSRSGLMTTDSQGDSEVLLPLTVDPLLASGNPSQPIPRRHLGDSFDHRMAIKWNNFASSTDSRIIFACGYPDYSFRVIDTDTVYQMHHTAEGSLELMAVNHFRREMKEFIGGVFSMAREEGQSTNYDGEYSRVRQVVYGHGDVVTCIARSETSFFADCYIVTGSLDCTIALWHFNGQYCCISGEYNQPGESPSPRAILTGHDAGITALAVSAEHGIVISGSEDGTILMHTTCGDLLRRVEGKLRVSILLFCRDCTILAVYGNNNLVTFTTTAKQLDEAKSDDRIECATLTRDGEFVVTGSDSGRISVWRLFPLEKLYTFQQVDSAVRSVAVAANHKFVLGGLDSGAIVVLNVDFNRWHYEYKQRYNK